MCIMEVRPGQHTATIVQAMAHNASTLDRDLDMLIQLVKARRDHMAEAMIAQAQHHIHSAYAILLGEFGAEVATVVADPAGHVHAHDDHGSERSLVEVAHHDAGLARRYETR